jgi:hypothetical protein
MGLVLGLIMLAASSGLLGAIFQMFPLFGGYLWVVVFRGAGLLLREFAWIWVSCENARGRVCRAWAGCGIRRAVPLLSGFLFLC